MNWSWSHAVRVCIAAAVLLAFLFVAALAVPVLVDSWRGLRAAFATGGQSGLIFVESPEVYTRQRLVNDRYLQDAWLRKKLDQIDAAEETWIDTVRLEQDLAALVLRGGTAPAAEGASVPAEAGLPAQLPLSFDRKFELQSNARDAIRQMILENALDDRHDLSGNTVFGLKFDTSVLPGSRARLSPTVIVRMEANPLGALSQPVEGLAPWFRSRRWTAEAQSDSAVDDLLRRSDGYFDAWRNNLEERLNRQRSIESGKLDECKRTALLNEELLAQPLCGPADALAPRAATQLRTTLAQSAAVDDALDFILRIPERNLSVARETGRYYAAEAAALCRIDSSGSLGDFVTTRRTRTFPLPQPWSTLFTVRLNPRASDKEESCGIELDIQLDPLRAPLLVVPRERADSARLFAMGLSPVLCNATPCAGGALSVWTWAEQAAAIGIVVDDPTLESLIPAMMADEGQLCLGERDFFRLPPGGPLPEDADCGPGWVDTFRAGAFQFLRRMTEVESYTYAAFPRGDVTGVVTETRSARSAETGIAGAAGSGVLTLGRQEREQRSDAQPSIINFASGARHELFDFGWSIVKDGVKTPMIASQLVLVSVPAYLDEIRLEIIKGFVDFDRLPEDWAGRRAEFAALGPEPTDAQRAALLEARVGEIFSSWEQRTLQLKVPPDYRALDGIVIGNSGIGGPRINAVPLESRCHDVDGADFTLAIPGERLWRSTVVTLDGRKASQIEVMPNMEGILATFGEPEGAPTGAAQVRARTSDLGRELTVWTSEGNDSVEITACPPDAAGLSGR